MDAQYLENYLHMHIPISAAMGITVAKAEVSHVILNAPLAANINHKKTVFGGSLHAVATLACWSLIHLNIMEIEAELVQIVISRSEVQYIAPVTSDFKAECVMPEEINWKRFVNMLCKKGKSRILLHAQIHQDNQLYVAYSGVFAALKTT